MTIQVMVADNQVNWLERIMRALKKSNIESIGATNVDQAKSQLSDSDLRVVCLNWMFPHVEDAENLLKFIRDRRPDVQVLLVSGMLSVGTTDELDKKCANLRAEFPSILCACVGKLTGTAWEKMLAEEVNIMLSNTKVRWGHISDLHLEEGDYDQKEVVRTLLEDLAMQTPLDFLVVSGDLTHSGSQREFLLAKTFLDNALSKTGLTKKQLFVVPGNHDVEWDKVKQDEVFNRGMESFLVSEGAVGGLFTHTEHETYRQKIFERLANYSQFTREYFPDMPDKHMTYKHYFHNETLNKSGLGNVSITSLNSAWSSAIHFDYEGKKAKDDQKILIGEHQVVTSIDFVVKQSSRIKIAIVHHSKKSLNEFEHDRCWRKLTDSYHIILHGHEHIPISDNSIYTTGLTLGVGAATHKRGKDKYYNSHNRYYLSEIDWSSGRGTQILRKFSSTAGVWIEDNETAPKYKDGRVPFTIKL